MQRFPWGLKSPQQYAQSGGDNHDFTMSKVIRQTTDGLPTHLGTVYVVVSGTIVQAASCPAIAAADWYRILGIEVRRKEGDNSFRPKFEGIRAWNALTNRNLQRDGVLPALAANTGSVSVSTAVTLRFPIHYFAPGLQDPYFFMWPVASFRGGSINVALADPASNISSYLSWSSSVQLTVDLDFDLYADHEEHIGAEFEVLTQDKTYDSGVTDSMLLDAGTYAAIVLCPPKLGGGDDVTQYTQISALDYHPQRLPQRSGTQYRDSLYNDAVLSTADNLVAQKHILPIIGFGSQGLIWDERLRAPIDWRLDLLSSGLSTGPHRALLVRLKPRRTEDETDVLKYFGHDPAKVTPVARVAGGPIEQSALPYFGVNVHRAVGAHIKTNVKPNGTMRPRPTRADSDR